MAPPTPCSYLAIRSFVSLLLVKRKRSTPGLDCIIPNDQSRTIHEDEEKRQEGKPTDIRKTFSNSRGEHNRPMEILPIANPQHDIAQSLKSGFATNSLTPPFIVIVRSSTLPLLLNSSALAFSSFNGFVRIGIWPNPPKPFSSELPDP